MSVASLILGESGRGKSSSMRNLEPTQTLLVQPIRKILPFERSNEWKVFNPDTKVGNILLNDDPDVLYRVMTQTKKKIIIFDDYQFVILNEFMRRGQEKGFGKFTDIAHKSWQLMMKANDLPDDVTVYFMWHPDFADDGRMICKTAGKLLQDKIEPPSMFSICFIATKSEGKYLFQTQSNGDDPAKTPPNMFDGSYIDNDLKVIDDRIREYFKLGAANA